MPYSTLPKIKKWLQIDSDDTRFDEELTEIQQSTSNQIEIILGRFTTLPIQDEEILEALSDIEAEWCAGIFRARREISQALPEQQRQHPYISEAKARLLDLIKSKYLTSFETA